MSLLMDALKRAETSKQEAQRAAAGATGREAIPANTANLSLEPLGGAAADGKSLPDLAAHIDALDAELAITPSPAPAPRRNTPPPAQPVVSIELEPPLDSEEEKQAAARNAFAAKLAERPSRRPMWLALGTLGLATAGIGTYVFFQLQSMNSGTLAPDVPRGRPGCAAGRKSTRIPGLSRSTPDSGAKYLSQPVASAVLPVAGRRGAG
jgi:hypothetical protein